METGTSSIRHCPNGQFLNSVWITCERWRHSSHYDKWQNCLPITAMAADKIMFQWVTLVVNLQFTQYIWVSFIFSRLRSHPAAQILCGRENMTGRSAGVELYSGRKYQQGWLKVIVWNYSLYGNLWYDFWLFIATHNRFVLKCSQLEPHINSLLLT